MLVLTIVLLTISVLFNLAMLITTALVENEKPNISGVLLYKTLVIINLITPILFFIMLFKNGVL